MAHENLFLGIMSGTSLDGVDVVLANFDSNTPKLLANTVYPIANELKQKILETINPNWQGSLEDIGVLHIQLGHLFADACNNLIDKEHIKNEKITAIGSHGQTVWHHPNGKHPFTLQLGDANIIAEKTGITSIADFRSRDIAAGGQGAPLVPAFHQSYLQSNQQSRVILNIGGIANITRLPTNTDEEIVGFDTGPGNGLIDAWYSQHHSSGFDKEGKWASSGEVKSDLLKQLLQDSYFSQPIPKSTGKETFNISWLKSKLGNDLKNHDQADIQATLTELTAKSISQHIEEYEAVYICGGGLKNKYLIERLKAHLPNNEIDSTEVLGIHPDWMEALAFAWLAKQTLEAKSGNLPSVTGAKGFRILGGIYQA